MQPGQELLTQSYPNPLSRFQREMDIEAAACRIAAITGDDFDMIREGLDQALENATDYEKAIARIEAVLREEPDPDTIDAIRALGKAVGDGIAEATAPPRPNRHERRKQAALARKGKRR